MKASPEVMTDHWWWRPGWREGRRFYTWHLTFADQPDVCRFIGAYRDALSGLPGLTPVPDRWLHLTMQGLGFVDEVDETDVREIVAGARSRLARLAPFEVAFETASVTPEAVESFAEPAKPVADLRLALRGAIGEVWPTVPEPQEGFRPHVSVAYSSAASAAGPIVDALSGACVASAKALISSAELIVLHRDRQMYEWEAFAEIPLG
ncbi:2'-5' RNA ligase family protein [Streptomyces sp. NPDC048172]|uniref:2'-5' RNA ligase family protein n=1 Tax=Streptomyces sp. NPDC048172 TaxID=3365505 RepID=UPI00371EA77D